MSDLKTTKELLELAIDCSNWLKGEKYDSLLINCMNKIGTYSTTINTESVISKWTQKNFLKIKHFNLDDVYDVKAYSIKPYPNKIRNAVTRDENVITLNLNSLMEYDSIRIEVDYKMDEDFGSVLINNT